MTDRYAEFVALRAALDPKIEARSAIGVGSVLSAPMSSSLAKQVIPFGEQRLPDEIGDCVWRAKRCQYARYHFKKPFRVKCVKTAEMQCTNRRALIVFNEVLQSIKFFPRQCVEVRKNANLSLFFLNSFATPLRVRPDRGCYPLGKSRER